MSSLYKKSKILLDAHDRINKEIAATSARIYAANYTLTKLEVEELRKKIYFPLVDVLGQIEVDIEKQCEQFPIYGVFLKPLNVDPYLALKMLVKIKDIKRFENVSNLWSYTGFAPIKICETCGKRYFDDSEWEKFVKRYAPVDRCNCSNPKVTHHSNRTGSFDQKLKITLNQMGEELIEYNQPYRNAFKQYKKEEKLKINNDVHVTNRARRKVIKVFLFHLFNEWRELEGLERKQAYIGLPELMELV